MMRIKSVLLGFVFIIFFTETGFAQTLPSEIRKYLNENYKGWKFQGDTCFSKFPRKAVVAGNFNGDGKLDYAVKFVQGKKGFILAFLAQRRSFKAFVLHATDADDVRYLTLDVSKKGERFELGGQNVFLNYDAPSDFRCESDVGGIHLYRNGKFIAY
jgi:hypothetical protein